MASISQRFFQSFKNLKSDAVPRPPRPERNGDTNGNDSQSDVEEIVIEPNTEKYEDIKKPKSEKNFFSSKKRKNSNSKKDTKPTSPINAQAGASVYVFDRCENVHLGPEIIYNFGISPDMKEENKKYEPSFEMTESIQCVMEASIKAENKYIDYVSKNLGKNWRSFFRTLGYSQGKIETVEHDEARNGVSEARYKLLLDWVRNDDEGTLGRLATLLWEDGEREIVQQLAVIYEKNTQSEI